MDDDNLVGQNLIDLDLNQEPMDSPSGSVEIIGSLLNDLESAHNRIEQRIQLLEDLTVRAMQQHRWRQALNSTEISRLSREMTLDVDVESSILDGHNSSGIVETTDFRGKCSKSCNSKLVAKALELYSGVKKVDKEGGSFYDCNICLDPVKEPVLTCCGHLFCWSCFYQVPYIDSTSKECPVCLGEVSDSAVITIYGNRGSEKVSESEPGLKIPPRPKSQRVESVRQQRFGTHGPSQVPVAEALRRIRMSIGAVGDQTQQQESGQNGNFNLHSEAHEGQNEEATRHLRIQHALSEVLRIQHASSVLSESAASLFSLSDALHNAGRVVENLETVMNSSILRSDARTLSVEHSADIQSNDQNTDSVVEMISALPIPSSSRLPDISDSDSVVGVLTRRASRIINLPVAPSSSSSSSSSSRRRSNASRVSDAERRDSHESRRRRLN